MQGKTLVIGASPNPDRYSYKAIVQLRKHGYEVAALGLRAATVADVEILTGTPAVKQVHTITLYLGAERQKELYPYLLSLHPERIIFNPGAENAEFRILAEMQGIETLEACTLVMLSTGQYDQ